MSWHVTELPDGQQTEIWLIDLLPAPILWSDLPPDPGDEGGEGEHQDGGRRHDRTQRER